jgi:acyl carrier protein
VSEPFHRLRSLIAEVLRISEGEIQESTGQENLEAWDSVAHLNLMLALEEEYAIRIGVEEIARLTSVPAILSHIGAS